ncbi:MAG: hypothetical protein L3J86_01380 [Thermoplasmata archaeon]|nr:hypothetical protein [Thermoplasmata archaeon]
MAKKGKRKLDEAGEIKPFEFPEFDERKFLLHDYEQTIATAIAISLAVGLGALSWALDRTGLPLVVPVVVAIAIIVFSPYLFQRLRETAGDYTKGDWAGLILTEAFGWLGIWFLLIDVLRIGG